jgi:hypothetical protein
MKIVYWDQKYKEFRDMFFKSMPKDSIAIHDKEISTDTIFYKDYVELFKWIE